MSSGITDQSLVNYLENEKKNGVSQKEIAAIITHVAFYSGWSKAWAVFNLAKEIWKIDVADESSKEVYQASILFPIGHENTEYKKYFIGQSYLAPIANEGFPIFNVTFEPECRNHWHTNTAEKGGRQMLICVGGVGYYQEFWKKAVKLFPGDTVTIPVNVKH